LEAWLSRITTNVFLDEVRRRKRRPTQPLPEETDAALAGADDVESALAATTLPEEIQSALASLAEDFRVAVVLCDVVGMRYGEIADHVGAPVGTVRSRIHRGRAQLRQALR
jgi:RNA polymerase sigma-70 factor (ECF subfamily)